MDDKQTDVNRRVATHTLSIYQRFDMLDDTIETLQARVTALESPVPPVAVQPPPVVEELPEVPPPVVEELPEVPPADVKPPDLGEIIKPTETYEGEIEAYQQEIETLKAKLAAYELVPKVDTANPDA